MHFTGWQNNKATEGVYADASRSDFLSFIAKAELAADKSALGGWSPAKFRRNHRAKADVEAVSAIVLDDDTSGLPIDQVVALYSGVAGVVHTTFSHTAEAPKYRIVLFVSRDMTVDEHARVWGWCAVQAAERGQPLDAATRDASRLWYVPAHREGAPYEWRELTGEPLPVDAILASAPATPSAAAPAPVARASAPANRRKALVAAVGVAWPPEGAGRHEAQLALAGALRAEGFSPEDALEFLCAVCRAAGDEDRPKRAKTIEHTYALAPDAPMTSWTRLKQYVDPIIVDAARGALGRDAAWSEAINRHMAEAALDRARSEPLPTPVDGKIEVDGWIFETRGLDAPLPPLEFQIAGLICKGDVVMFVAQGNSLKTWLAFSIALAVSTGRRWLDRFVPLRGRVGILDYESGEYEVKRRLKLLGGKDADNVLRSSYSGKDLADPATWLTLAKLRLDLLIVDSFHAAGPPDLNENDASADSMLQHAGAFAERTGCTVIFIHHARKGAGGDRRESVRGSTALYAACDRIFEFDDVEKLDGGVIRTTLRSIKDGAGRRPEDFRVELSDRGLRFVEEALKVEEKAKDNREIILGHLEGKSAGVPKGELMALLTGRKEIRLRAFAELSLASITVEFTSEKKTYVMLNPNRSPSGPA